MASLFQRFQEAIKTLARSPTFVRDPRRLQFESDVNGLFLYTSYNRLGKNADEKDVDEIIDMANKASFTDQQKQVQENIHFQIKNICRIMDGILLSDINPDSSSSVSEFQNDSRCSGLGFAIGRGVTSANQPVVHPTRSVTRLELSQSLRDLLGYTLDIRQSQIPHKDAGQGLFVSGEASVGAVLAFYPGVIYSPAYYRYIPGYPRIDACNSYLITRYDGIVINAQPWGAGGETREIWDGSYQTEYSTNSSENFEGQTDRMWRMLSKPLDSNQKGNRGDILERRNPIALGHFANHPPKGAVPNVMVCPYDFPVTEKDMRVYIPNLVFGNEENVTMKRFGSFWFKSGGSHGKQGGAPVVRTLALVATRALRDEEVFLNYRLSNSKRRPEWYTPVDEEEDRRRWS
ncbi:uncharacterized protein [Typha angustifolia]|uniref:uncharacterized protein n=1 Tax=Typha angustifolia TaxID=59011 RepID=UPI003C2BFEB3